MRLEITQNAKDFVKEIAETEEKCFSEPWSESAVSGFLSFSYNGALVCLCDGKFAGYITYTAVCDEVQIANVATEPSFRRKGVGRCLVEELKKLAVENKSTVIMLEVRESNVPAISLYENAGFERVGVRKNFYKKPDENAILMNFVSQ